MSEQYYAAIDLGTNSCRMIISDSLGNYVYNHSAATCLGKGMSKNNCFTPEAVERGIGVLKEFGEILKESHCRYRAIATAACRMAKNGTEFVQRVKKECGINLEIIDGREEARLNLLGAISNADKTKPYVIVYDIGGGSTEITLAKFSTAEIVTTISIPWGARNASEHFDINNYEETKAQNLKNEVLKYMAEFKQLSNYSKYQEQVSVIATSSTPLRLSAYINRRKEYNREREDGSVMSCEQLNEAIETLRKTTETERASSVYIGPKRAPIFIAGSILMKTIYEELQAKQIIASYKSAKDSIIIELMNEDKNGTSD